MSTTSGEIGDSIIWLQASLRHHITNDKEGDVLKQTHTGKCFLLVFIYKPYHERSYPSEAYF